MTPRPPPRAPPPALPTALLAPLLAALLAPLLAALSPPALAAAALAPAPAPAPAPAQPEFTVCSLAHGCCTTLLQKCATADRRTYTVSTSDPACPGLPHLLSSAPDGSQVAGCLAANGTCHAQSFAAASGAVSLSFAFSARPVGAEWALALPGGIPACTTRGGSCSAGGVRIRITAADATCGGRPLVTLKAGGALAACLPEVWGVGYQDLSVYRMTGVEAVTACGAPAAPPAAPPGQKSRPGAAPAA